METPEFIKRQYVEFRKNYRNWFKDLSDQFPDQKKTTVKYYKEHMEDSHTELLTCFFNSVSPLLERISDLDYSVFDDCANFYSCIEYSKMMASENGKKEDVRKAQMAFLNKLSYMTILLNDFKKSEQSEQSEEVKELEQEEKRNEMEKYTPLLIKFLTNIQVLDGTNMEEVMKNFETAFNPENFNDADKAFINDNPLLSELADEISKEVKIPESFKNITNPKDIFKIMFNKEGKDFMEEMVKTVGGKIQDKIKSGKISEKDLFSQAQKMMGNVFNNPMFAAMGGMPGMAGMGAMAAGDQQEEQNEKKENLRNKMRDKLKKKKGQ
jgi:hypothetical protein